MEKESEIKIGKLSGKVAIVTGGANGIGNGIVRRYLEGGAKVVFTDVVQDQAEATEKELKNQGYDVSAVVADQSSEEDWKRVVDVAKEKYGMLHILVNNAGINTKCAMPEVDLDVWNRVISVNLTGPMLGMQTCASLIRESGGGLLLIFPLWEGC